MRSATHAGGARLVADLEVLHDSPEPAPRPMRKDAVRNRDRVMKAADEVFAEAGLEASLADIAKRAGVGMGTIYRNFPDKDALVAQLLEDKMAAVQVVAERAAQEPSGWLAFCRLMEELTTQVVADRALAEIMLSDYGPEHAGRGLEAVLPAAGRIIRRARKEGSLRPEISANDLPVLLAMTSSVASLTARVRPEAWRRYLQPLLDGLRADGIGTPLPARALTDRELETAVRTAPRPRGR